MKIKKVPLAIALTAYGSFACGNLAATPFPMNNPEFGLVIHGGAGTISPEKITPIKRQMIEKTLSHALTSGYAILESGGTSEDAVVAAVRVLEDSPLFNAGKGAVYTFDEVHELDASLATGHDRQAGAVSGVKTVKNPIELAQQIKNNSVHVMLSGEGAQDFAKQQGIALVDNDYFDTKSRFEALKRVKEKLAKSKTISQYQANHRALDDAFKMGTVGAVALDKNGNLAAGTSTGGMTAKRFGRIGDSPIIGAGTYADKQCAVSATGHGEYFIRYQVTTDICKRFTYLQEPLKQAAQHVIFNVLDKNGGSGGIISMDSMGNIAMPYNTSGMYRGYQTANKGRFIAIFKSDK